MQRKEMNASQDPFSRSEPPPIPAWQRFWIRASLQQRRPCKEGPEKHLLVNMFLDELLIWEINKQILKNRANVQQLLNLDIFVCKLPTYRK